MAIALLAAMGSASGDQAAASGPVLREGAQGTQIAAMLVPKRLRLIIKYQRISDA